MPRLPICVSCQIEMEPVKNCVVVEIMAGADGYQKIMADKFGCPNCKVEIVTGFARTPLAEHWQPGYADGTVDLKAWRSLRDQQIYDTARAEAICRRILAEGWDQ